MWARYRCAQQSTVGSFGDDPRIPPLTQEDARSRQSLLTRRNKASSRVLLEAASQGVLPVASTEKFSPRDENSVTIWIPLDLATEETGVVQYALGSHRWPRESLSASTSTFHNPDVTAALTAAAKGNPVDVSVEALEPGFCFVHHQDVWHGSTSNSTSDRHRRAL
eukprot:gene6324-9689_t